MQPSLLYTSHMYFSSHVLKNVCPLELEGITSVVIVSNDCANSCYKQDDPPLWIAENLMTHPLPRAQKLMSPPPILFDQSLRGGIIRPSYKYFKENLFIGKWVLSHVHFHTNQSSNEKVWRVIHLPIILSVQKLLYNTHKNVQNSSSIFKSIIVNPISKRTNTAKHGFPCA